MVVREVDTQRVASSGSVANRVVAIVVSGLVYGALVYVSRFTPHVFGIQIIFPAVAVAPAFGLWWGVWGPVGIVLGTIVSQFPAGINPLLFIPANLGQGLYSLIPAVIYRKLTLDSARDWLAYGGACLVGAIVVELLLLWNLNLLGYVPFAVGIRTFGWLDVIDSVLWMVVIGPIILRVVSPYIVKSGLRFNRFI